ncbi:hypothetical protein DXD51_01090 [Eubacterium sp. TM05-53]|nr:hypothetical protein DXD51_01090 [Eubacterium sp. TM05-53]
MILFHYFNRIRLKFMKMTMVLIWKKMKSIMHGVIATYERIYFTIGIVYSSKTGNTQFLANGLNFMESKYCVPVENAKNLEPVNLLCIGFWCDKGDCDDQMKQYLSALRNQNVFLFGTAGFGKSNVVLHAKCKNVANKMQKIGFKKRHFNWLLNAK